MPLTNDHEILLKVEDDEGVDASPTSVDSMVVFDPAVQEDPAFNERRPAGAGISRAKDAVGIQKRGFTFDSDFVGSGDNTTAPEFGRALRSAGWDESPVTQLDVTGIGAGETFQIGERVSIDNTGFDPSDTWGICLNELDADGELFVLELFIGGSGVFAGTDVIASENSGTVASITTASSTDEGFAYNPTSNALLRVTMAAGGWTGGGGDPVIGDVLVFRETSGSGIWKAAAQIIEITGDDYDVVVHAGFGQIVVNLVAVAPSGDTRSVHASNAPVALSSPSVTIYSTLGGLLRKGLGQRADFTLAGDAGGELQFSWNFNGTNGGEDDGLPAGGSSTLPNTPRLESAIFGIGDGADFVRLPIHAISITPGNQLADRLDGTAPEGIRSAGITDRELLFTLTVDQVGVDAMAWHARMKAGQTVRFGLLLNPGGTAGDRLAILGNQMQIKGYTDGDQDGFATTQVTLAAKKIRTEGDDETVIAQF